MEEEQIGAGGAQLLQCGSDLTGRCLGPIVADPGFEQITEDVERAGPARRAAQEIQQKTRGLALTGLQMKVGDQIDRALTQGVRPAR